MRFSASLAGLLASLALLAGVFASADASAKAAPREARAGAISAGRALVPHGRRARRARRLARAAHGRRAVSDNVSLAATRSRKAKEAASATPSDLLFDGSHVSDFPLIQSAPNAITEVPDPMGSGETDFQMTVNNSDVAPVTPTQNPRAQALSPSIIENGDEFWLSTKFLIPTNYPTEKKGWISLVEIFGSPFSGSSPWQIEIVDNRLQWMRNATYHYDVPWQMPVIKGSWVNVLLHERFANDGFVEMWIDGQPVSFFGRETRLNMETMDSSNDEGPNSAKIMQYREAGMFETGTIYFGPLKIGLTQESVAA